MPRTRGPSHSFAKLLSAVLVGLSLFVASGCGGANERFSQAEADRALAALDALQSDIDDGRCKDAARQVNRLAVQSTHINEDRSELGEAWASSVARLNQLVVRECIEITPAGPTAEATADTGPTESGPTEPVKPSKPDGSGRPDNGGQNGAGGDQNGGAGGGENPPDNGTGDNTDDGNSQPPADTGGAGPGT